MKLYLLSQTVNSGYDTYDSAVVCAANEEEARLIDVAGVRAWESALSVPRLMLVE